jgi:hypothetical protein
MVKSGVKSFSLTGKVPPILIASREVGACGTSGGAVKCVDIGRNAGGESDVLDLF